MVARQEALTRSFSRQLLAVWGADVTLPNRDGDGNAIPEDQRAISALFKPSQQSVVDELANIIYREYELRIPPDGLGRLEQGMVVTIADRQRCGKPNLPGQTYYVANVAPVNLGRHVDKPKAKDERPCNGG